MSDGAVSRLCGTAHRATVRQKKPEHPVRFELTEQTRDAIDDHIKDKPRSRRHLAHNKKDLRLPPSFKNTSGSFFSTVALLASSVRRFWRGNGRGVASSAAHLR